MSKEQVQNVHKKGSFHWYISLNQHFFKHITRSIMHADTDNLSALKRIFPHMVEAHSRPDWNEPPKVNFPIELNIEKYKEEFPKKDFDYVAVDGSFLRYLYNSGHFVSSMSRAILYADEHNRSLIEREYPQMVAAYNINEWQKAPDGFEPIYNSKI